MKGLFQCPPWARSFCPFRACPNVPPTASRCTAIYVPTWLAVRRHAVLGASGAQLLAMWVSWWIGGKAKM